MKVLLKTIGFSLGLTLVFTLVTYLLPQMKGEAPVEKSVDLGSLTMDDFVALGEDLFNNKGTCTLCHKPPPLGRAPDIQGEDMVALSAARLADERYQGEAKDAAG
ncbi:MAG: cytochrome C, partial [Pseudomonadota bacterium]